MSFFQLSRATRVSFAACVLTASLFGVSCGRTESKADAAGAGDAKGGKGGAATQPAGQPVAVTTATAVVREVPSFIQATGSLIADETSNVAPQVSGQVIPTPVNIGAFVRQGEVIARLNPRDPQLRLARVRAKHFGVRVESEELTNPARPLPLPVVHKIVPPPVTASTL